MPGVGAFRWSRAGTAWPGAAGPAARGSRRGSPLGQGALPGLGAPTAAVLCGQADKRLVPAVVPAAVAAAGDRRGAAVLGSAVPGAARPGAGAAAGTGGQVCRVI